ncbi:MAG: cupin [Candidatus Riflebacteria bacterium]|nr:cupin [Candidatus Riflebacteria bacterium]
MKIIEKPWGKEEIIEVNEKYMVKRLTMFKGHRCSLQYHNFKKETVYLLSGQLRILLGTSLENLEPRILALGESITLVPKLIHRMEALEESVYLEASTPEMDDVVRLSDDYKRELK